MSVARSAHDWLSVYGAVWCIRLGCAVARTEIQIGHMGVADAVGFGITRGNKRGIVIESKVSRADFKRDQKKWHRRAGATHGDAHFGWSDHYYIAPDGLLNPEEIPEAWGLLVVGPGETYPRIAKRAEYMAPDPAWWAHHFATCAKGLTAWWAKEQAGLAGYGTTVTIPGMPDELAHALAPLTHTTTNYPPRHEFPAPTPGAQDGEGEGE